MDKLDTALAQIVEQLQHLAAQHGSDAVHLMGTVIQMQAIGDLLQSIPAIVCFIGAALLLRFGVRKLTEDNFDSDTVQAIMIVVTVVSGFAIILSGIGVVITFGNVFNPVIWSAAFDPKIAIAAHVLKLL